MERFLCSCFPAASLWTAQLGHTTLLLEPFSSSRKTSSICFEKLLWESFFLFILRFSCCVQWFLITSFQQRYPLSVVAHDCQKDESEIGWGSILREQGWSWDFKRVLPTFPPRGVIKWKIVSRRWARNGGVGTWMGLFISVVAPRWARMEEEELRVFAAQFGGGIEVTVETGEYTVPIKPYEVTESGRWRLLMHVYWNMGGLKSFGFSIFAWQRGKFVFGAF